MGHGLRELGRRTGSDLEHAAGEVIATTALQLIDTLRMRLEDLSAAYDRAVEKGHIEFLNGEHLAVKVGELEAELAALRAPKPSPGALMAAKEHRRAREERERLEHRLAVLEDSEHPSDAEVNELETRWLSARALEREADRALERAWALERGA